MPNGELFTLGSLADHPDTVIRPGIDYGRNVFSYSPYYGEEARQRSEVIFPRLVAALDDYRNKSRPPGFPTMPNPRTPQNHGTSTYGTPVTPESVGVTTITKDPEVEGDISNFLGKVRGAELSNLSRQPRSTRLDETLGRAFERFRGSTSNAEQSLKDFVSEFLSVRPETKAVVDQEVNALGRFFGGPEEEGSLANSLASNASNRSAAVAQNVRRALGQLGRTNKIARMTGGDSSYLDKQFLNTAAGVLAEEARQRADMERANLLQTAQLQAGTAGRRQDMLDSFARAGIIPTEAQQRFTSNELAQLAQLGGTELPNLVVERESDRLARELDLLGGASNLRQSIRAYAQPTNNLNPFNYYNLPYDYGMQPDAMDNLSFEQILGLIQPNNVPQLRTTSGSLAPAIRNFSDTPGIMDYGPGSLASDLGFLGTTRVGQNGAEYIMGPNGLELVGADRLTPTQRLFD